jgi:hypothetical protein
LAHGQLGHRSRFAWELAMPAFRIVYLRNEASRPETITAGFDNLDQAMNVFAARGLRILYIAEQCNAPRRLDNVVGDAARKAESKAPARSSFPLRRFSARLMA